MSNANWARPSRTIEVDTMNREIEEYLASRVNGTYERDNFERYIAKRKLSLSTPTIHVTGSNGKGSTCRYLEAIYLSAGYEVASFIKPRFYAVNECIRVNGKEYVFIDAAGLRRKSKIKEELERFSIIRAVTAIERADAVIIMIDAVEGLTEQDIIMDMI